MNKWLDFWKLHWKSSVQGLLQFLVVSSMSIAGWLTLQIALDPGWAKNKSYIYIAGGCALVTALGKAWLGLFQKDAGTVLAKVPGVAEPQAVSAHPLPDDPRAKVVVQKEAQ